MATDVVIALTTCTEGEAPALAETLVSRNLAACVNIVPRVQSVYRWQGKLARDAESLLVMKTTAEGLAALQAAVLELHSYEVPEFVALTVASGHGPYLDWVVKSVA